MILQEQSSKVYLLRVFGSGHSKIVLTLLNKLVTFHVRLIIIQIRVPELERFIQDLFSSLYSQGCRGLVLYPINISLHEFFKKVIV